MTRSLVLALSLLLATQAHARATVPGERAAPSYFVVVGDVTEPDGSRGALGAEVRRMFVERLKQRPDVTLEAPTWLPTQRAEMIVELHRHGMRAYNASVKILSVKSELAPLPGDPTHGTLTLTARVSIYGHTLAEHALKIGGEGESSGSMPVAVAYMDVARAQLSREVIDAALQEAMTQTATKIQIVAARERAGR
jgi:hypothetical protein